MTEPEPGATEPEPGAAEPEPGAAEPEPGAAEPAGTKSERTRAVIVEAALGLFRERGYERTTMRAVAQAAGVSVGNAYYYFRSKEELVQGFYDRLAADHVAAAAAPLATGETLGERLHGTLLAWLDVAEPYHALAGRFFAVAAQPGNPLSPFSPESHAARDAELALYREVISGSSIRVSDDVVADLPELLWLYHLGIVLYWVHDNSTQLRCTRALIERTVPMVERLCRRPGCLCCARWPVRSRCCWPTCVAATAPPPARLRTALPRTVDERRVSDLHRHPCGTDSPNTETTVRT